MNKHLILVLSFLLYYLNISAMPSGPSRSCGTTTLTASTGTFDDGSGSGNYANNTNCTWLISPGPNYNSVTLNFTSFITDTCCDSVFVYDGTTSASPLLGVFLGNLTTNLPAVTSTGSSMFIVFKTDTSRVFAGWTANYVSNIFCGGTTVLNAASGTFSDGSGAFNYFGNSDCSWLISPGANFAYISLDFSTFATESVFDIVRVYDGADTNAALLGTFSGTSTPPTITSSGSQLFVRFTTNSTTSNSGWSAIYQSHFCRTTTTLTGMTGSFTDGSGTADYTNLTRCSWLIQPVGTFNTIALSFSNFSTEANGDFVRIYDGPDNLSPLLAAYNGSNLPPVTHSTGTSMFVEFISDNSITFPGWSASYITNCTPSVSITGSSNICPGGTANFSTLSTVNAGTTPVYQWKVNGSNVGTNSSTFSSNTIHDGDIVTLVMTSGASCAYPLSPSSNSILVIVQPIPITINASATSLCTGNSLTLSGSGATSYAWSPGVTNNVPFVPPLGTTTYSVIGTDANNCTGTQSIDITVHSRPSPSIVSNTGSFIVCSGNSVTLNAGSGYLIYHWSNFLTTQTINASSNGNYTVVVTDGNGCTGSKSITLSVISNPSPTITGNLNICNGFSTTLNASNGFSHYLWTTGETTRTISTTATGPYTVTVTNASGCTGTYSVNLTSDSLTPSITGNSNICNGSPTTLNAGSGYAHYLWSTAATTQSISVSTAGTFMVTVTNSYGCSGSDTINMTVNSILSPEITGTYNICSGQSTTLDAGAGYNSYLWSNNATTQTITATSSGVYHVTVSSSSGCSGTDTFNLSVLSDPVPVISGLPVICSGNSSDLDAGNNYSEYLWSTGELSQVITVLNPGIYTVTVTNAAGCTGSDTINISVNTSPTPVITGNTTLCIGSSTNLDAGSGYVNYLWSTGATTQTTSVSTEGLLMVTVTNSTGCTGVDTSVITIDSISTNITGNTIICPGDSSVLCADGGFLSYHWSNNTTLQCMTTVTSGNYTTTVTDIYGCSVSNSVTVYAVNINPSITETGNMLICDTFDPRFKYQWLLNGNPFPDCAADTCNATFTGNYSVIVTDTTTSCTDTSTAYFVAVGIQDLINEIDITAYPNPTTGLLSIIGKSLSNGNYKIMLSDVLGHEMLLRENKAMNNSIYEQIDLKDLTAGIYLLTIHSDKMKKVIMVQKQ